MTRRFLWLEFILLCVVIPGIIIVYRLAPFMILFLWGASFYAWYRFNTLSLRPASLWNVKQVTWAHMRPILTRFMFAALILTLGMWWFEPERLFTLIRTNPTRWAMVMLLYPIVSALPQEFIFCSFFFARYEPLFGQGRSMILASAIIFAYAHMLFINPVAPLLSLIAGIFFAETYKKYQSLALVTIEHALYGNFVFTLGLGWYFYGGNIAHH